MLSSLILTRASFTQCVKGTDVANGNHRGQPDLCCCHGACCQEPLWLYCPQQVYSHLLLSGQSYTGVSEWLLWWTAWLRDHLLRAPRLHPSATANLVTLGQTEVVGRKGAGEGWGGRGAVGGGGVAASSLQIERFWEKHKPNRNFNTYDLFIE